MNNILIGLLFTSILIGPQKNHVQGIAYDKETEKMYLSFTTRFLVADSCGTITASVDTIHGHLGAMTFDPVGRKVYASLECKDDEIGSAISKGLGVQGYKESSFYIAQIDVDSVRTPSTAQSKVIKRFPVYDAIEDYKTKVVVNGDTLLRKYGCTGIDGMTIGPGFGGDANRYLYVAYGIKSDTTRMDNDYQVLLQYRLSDISRGVLAKPEQYFIKTGNTTYGVQNLAYDSHSGLMYMAVYKGKKSRYTNYDMFTVDMSQKPVKAKLEGVPYEKGRKATLLPDKGIFFDYGSLGMCPLGDGLWYFAIQLSKKHDCKIALYRWNGENNFDPVF